MKTVKKILKAIGLILFVIAVCVLPGIVGIAILCFIPKKEEVKKDDHINNN